MQQKIHNSCTFVKQKVNHLSHSVSYAECMENKKLNISWALIEFHLQSMERDQAWLGRELNVGNNVITNWKSRGGAPAARAPELARILGITVSELLGEQGTEVIEKRAPPYVASLINSIFDLYAEGASALTFKILAEIINLMRQDQAVRVQPQSKSSSKSSHQEIKGFAGDPFGSSSNKQLPDKKAG